MTPFQFDANIHSHFNANTANAIRGILQIMLQLVQQVVKFKIDYYPPIWDISTLGKEVVFSDRNSE